MILKKAVKETAGGQSASSAAILGLKVVGGKRLGGDRLGAAIERVKKGSIADSVGHLRPGGSAYPDWAEFILQLTAVLGLT